MRRTTKKDYEEHIIRGIMFDKIAKKDESEKTKGK